MTTKAIALVTGKTDRSVQRWVNKLSDKVSSIGDKVSSSTSSHPADFTLEETLQIIECGMGRNAADIYRENALRSSPAAGAAPDIAAIVQATITAMVPALVAAVRGIIPAETAVALPAPENIQPRDQLRRLVNAYARTAGTHREAWNNLYQEYYYRYHRNIRECAKNRGIDTLDYAEDEGLMGELLCLAASMAGAA